MNSNCEECEESKATINCPPCGQILCTGCDKKIHNKGKRVLHQRDQIQSEVNQSQGIESQKSLLLKQDAHVLRHEQHKERFKQIGQLTQTQQNKQSNPSLDMFHFNSINIPVEYALKYINIQPLEQLEAYLIKNAQQGHLMLQSSDFERYLQSKEITKLNSSRDVIGELEKLKLINITTRKFGDSQPFQFISIAMETLSLQALYWVLLNLRIDEMTPTDKLVLSRIKECYGLQLNNQEWNSFIAGLYKLSDQNGLISFKCRGSNCVIKLTKCPMDLLGKSDGQNSSSMSSSQQLNNESLLLLTIEDGIQANMMDSKQMTGMFKQQWRLFITFLGEFFDSDVSITSLDTQSMAGLNSSLSSGYSAAQSVPTQKTQENQKWVRSVENNVQKHDSASYNVIGQLNQSYQSSQTQKKRNKKGQIKPPKSISKAIPGGKYGCAQLLKCCGSLQLKLCSLGVLCLMIQEAINRNILIYYKTLLIKPNTNIAFNFQDYLGLFDDDVDNQFILSQILVQDTSIIPNDKLKQEQEKQQKLVNVQGAVREILNEYKKGVSLARLPKLIQRKISFTFDLHELGFTKLKCFIQSIEGVSIINDGTTYASVQLDEYNHSQDQTGELDKGKEQIQQQQHQQQYSHNQFDINQVNSTKDGGNQINLDYHYKIESLLRQLLQKNQFGIQSAQLLAMLQFHLQSSIDFTLFGCNTFEEYLVKHADQYSDVIVKAKGCVVYPKGIQYYWNFQQQATTTQTIYNPHSHHQKSYSTNLPSYAQLQTQNQSSQIIKADSFLAGMNRELSEIKSFIQGQSQSLTFQSFNTNPHNREFFMIQEESSHNEIDANVKFIEELLKESDEGETKKKEVKQSIEKVKFQSLGCWPWTTDDAKYGSKDGQTRNSPQQKFIQKYAFPDQLQSWDFDNQQ